MSDPSPKQLSFIRTLVVARQNALNPAPEWLRPPKTSYEASKLINNLMNLPEDPKEVDPEYQSKIDRVKENIDSIGGGLRRYAESFVQQWERRKSLSEKQWVMVDKMIESLDNPTDEPDPSPGFYTDEEGIVIFVYKSRNGHVTSKTLTDSNSWSYSGKNGLRGAKYSMTDHEVSVLGRRISGTTTGLCVVCLAEGRDPTLTDRRSIAAGYGAICASRYGWHYPTAEEAEEILNVRL